MKHTKKTIIALALTVTLSSAAQAWTPSEIIEGYNSRNPHKVRITAGFVKGVKNTIDTVQNYGFIDKVICFPETSTLSETRDILNSVNKWDFDDTDDGGVVMIYTAYWNRSAC